MGSTQRQMRNTDTILFGERKVIRPSEKFGCRWKCHIYEDFGGIWKQGVDVVQHIRNEDQHRALSNGI
jgi:hypothetical protein